MVTLNEILQETGIVDLVDADIQGSEADVFETSSALLDWRVKRVHIGTHSEDQENRLRALFSELKWRPVFDFPCLGNRPTPWGPVEFQDGVQSWVNPNLARPTE